MDDRRRYKRLPMRGFMDCTVEFTTGSKTRSLQVLSLSAGGMYIATDERNDFDLERGVELEHIHFKLNELEALDLVGEIAHRMSLGEIGGCGVQFKEIRPTDSTLLERFVQRKLEEFGLAAM